MRDGLLLKVGRRGTILAQVSCNSSLEIRIPKPTLIVNRAGQIISANDSAADLMRSTRTELQSMHIRDTFHPDELPEGEAHLGALKPGDEIQLERWLRCCDKRYVRIEARARMLGDGRYRITMRPLSTEPVDLPPRLPPSG